MTADTAGCRSLADLIERMLSARWDSQKSLVVTSPSKAILRVPNNRGGEARWTAPKLLVIKCPKSKVVGNYSHLEELGNGVVISGAEELLGLLKTSVLKILKGEGDYSIEIGETQLWFWW